MQIVYTKNREISFIWSFGGIPKGDPKAPRSFDVPSGGRGSERSLDFASQPSQPISRRGFRRHPMTKSAKHKLLKCAALFDPQRKHRQVFLTGTLPGSTHEAQVEFARLFPQVVKLVQTYLPRAMRQSAAGMRYCWVAELQKRGGAPPASSARSLK